MMHMRFVGTSSRVVEILERASFQTRAFRSVQYQIGRPHAWPLPRQSNHIFPTHSTFQHHLLLPARNNSSSPAAKTAASVAETKDAKMEQTISKEVDEIDEPKQKFRWRRWFTPSGTRGLLD